MTKAEVLSLRPGRRITYTGRSIEAHYTVLTEPCQHDGRVIHFDAMQRGATRRVELEVADTDNIPALRAGWEN